MIKLNKFEIEGSLINPKWPIKIYRGHNLNGDLIYSIISRYEPVNLLSTKLIAVNKKYDYDSDEWILLFKLTSSSGNSKDMFKYIFKDILKTINIIESEEVILKQLCHRYEHWQKLLSKLPDSFGRLKQQGLLAELLVLKDNLIPQYGVEQALAMWQGPKGAKQDFILPENWVEVKSTSLGKREIHISSLEQLDSTISDGELVVITLQDSNSFDTNAISLSLIIDEIEGTITDDLTLADFKERLLLVGYGQNQDNEFYFRLCDIEYFNINKSFPKISRANLPAAISTVSYTLNLDALLNFKLE